MTPRRGSGARIYASVAGVLALLGTAVTVWLSRDNGLPIGTSEISLLVSFYLYLVVGILLLLRRPENRLGWLLTSVGLVPALGVAVQEYARLALVERPGLPGGIAAAWVSQLWWFANLAAVFIFVPLLFPTGRLPSPRWRWLVRLVIGVVAIIILMEAFGPDLSGQNGYELANPLAVAWVADLEAGLFGTALFAIIALSMLATIVSLILRFRRSRGIERQQLKWFVFGGIFVIGLPLLELLGVSFAGDEAFDFVLSFIPISIGIAVLRYRLYDIDRIISRTLTYGLLSAVLIGLYLAAVTALTAVTAPVAGDSPFAVAAATLLAAAAFRPARAKIQSLVDRRFNRARYDASQTVGEFRARLRDELELSAIAGNFTSAVDRTVQPAQVLVWLRPEGSQ